MTIETDDKLTTTEQTLRDVLAMVVAGRAGAMVRAHNWPEPDPDQCRAMTSTIIEALTYFVRGMRHPQALPASQEEINEIIEGMALGVVEKTMGAPARRETVH